MDLSNLPAINATLNSLSTLFLISGFVFIKKQKPKQHIICMTLAFVTSTLFLISYLYYHYHVGHTVFPGEGWSRPVYFGILISHIILAVVIVPLVLLTLFHGVFKRFDKHKKIARITLPLWLYVSVTGVLIYIMLYQINWS